MTKLPRIALGTFLLSAACAFAQGGRSIAVDIVYTGSGTVNASHKIYVALWDTADTTNSGPVEVKSIDSKVGSVTFTNVQKLPAYVNAAYDPSGKWTAQSPPPSGSSFGAYSTHPPALTPIDPPPGKTTKVKITFDDKVKTP